MLRPSRPVSLHLPLCLSPIPLSLSLCPCISPTPVSVSPCVCPPHLCPFSHTASFPPECLSCSHLSLSAHVSVCLLTPPSPLNLPVPHGFSPCPHFFLHSSPPLTSLCPPSLLLLSLGWPSSLDLRNPKPSPSSVEGLTLLWSLPMVLHLPRWTPSLSSWTLRLPVHKDRAR